MKKKKALFAVSIMLVSLMLCAFTAIPAVSFTFANSIADITYLKAMSGSETMTLDVNVSGNGDDFEIIKEISVYADKNLSDKLEMVKCTVGEGKLIYTFETSGRKDINNVYIEPPVLYTAKPINTVSVSANKNSICEDEDGNNWFTIAGVEVTDKTEKDIQLNVVITPHSDMLPRFPELVVDGNVYGGATAMEFDEKGEFIGGEFIFILPLDDTNISISENPSIESLASVGGDMTVRISDVMSRIEADENLFSSNIKNLTVVNSDPE